MDRLWRALRFVLAMDKRQTLIRLDTSDTPTVALVLGVSNLTQYTPYL